MKLLMFIVDEEKKEELEVLLNRAGVTGYTEMPHAVGTGRSGPRLGSRAFPKTSALIFTVLELVGLAPAAALSRHWERQADRCSLELTGDLESFERAHIELARKNLSDLSPPRLVYLLLFSHPTPSERLALGRSWAAES
mgnify:CR=1 FL=1